MKGKKHTVLNIFLSLLILVQPIFPIFPLIKKSYAATPPVLNEVSGKYTDGTDWVEIYNPEDIDLKDYKISKFGYPYHNFVSSHTITESEANNQSGDYLIIENLSISHLGAEMALFEPDADETDINKALSVLVFDDPGGSNESWGYIPNGDDSGTVTALNPWTKGFSNEADTNEIWVDDDFNSSNDGGHTWGYNAFNNIQNGVNAVDDAGKVYIANGTYVETVDISKSIEIEGESEAGVVVDTSSFNDYGIYADGDHTVKISNITVIGPIPASYGYGLKLSGENLSFILENITVIESGRSGIDINGASDGTITNITANNNGGVGLALTDSSNIQITNITTSGNAWAGMAVYTKGTYYTEGSDNITLQGVVKFSEPTGFYTEEDTNFGTITNLSIAPGTDFSQSTSTTIFEMKTQTSNVSAIGVNWGTLNLTDIENLIYHDVDDPNLSHVNYSNPVGTSDLNNVVSKIFTSGLTTTLTSNDGRLEISDDDSDTIFSIAEYAGIPNTGSLTIATPFGKYYEIQYSTEPNWPIDIKIYYNDPGDFGESVANEDQLIGIYYFGGSNWNLYSDPAPSTTGVDTTGNFLWANAYHLTPIVPGADTTPPNTPSLIFPTDGSAIKKSEAVFDWTDETDTSSPVTYNYKSSWLPSGSYGPVSVGAVSQINATGSTERTYLWQVQACDSIGNCSPWSGPWEATIDSAPPSSDPSGFSSSTHPLNTPTSNSNITVEWTTQGLDAISGVDGYSYSFSKDTVETPNNVKDIEETESNVVSEALADGNWYFNIKTVDNAGNWTSTANYGPMIIDTTAPEKPVWKTVYKGHNPASWVELGCGGFTNDTKTSFEWELNTESDIAGYYFGTKSNDHHQYFSHPNNLKTANITPGNNPYYYTIIAVDTAGNESPVSNQCNLTLDQVNPNTNISIGSPNYSSGGTTYVTTSTPFTLTPSDPAPWNSEIYKTYYRIDSESDTEYFSPFSINSSYGSGAHTIEYWSKDNAGNVENHDNISVNNEKPYLDDDVPTSSIINPANGAKYNASTWPSVNGTADDDSGSGIGKVELSFYKVADGTYWNGSSWQPSLVELLASGTTSWSYLWTPNIDGNFIAYAKATDNLSQKESTSTSTFTYDTTPPTISSVDVDVDYVKAEDVIVITAEISDPSGISATSADFSYNTAFTNRPSPTSVAMSNIEGNTYRVAYSIPISWNEGTLYVKVAAKDGTGGNYIRSSDYDTAVIDNSSPNSFNLSTPANGSATNDTTPILDWDNATDNFSTIAGYEVYLNLIKISGGSLISPSIYTITSDLTDGTYSWYIKAYDSVGFSADSATWTFNVDTVTPTSEITIPSNTGTNTTIYTNSWDGLIKGAAQDNNAGVGLEKVEVSIQRDSDDKYWDGTSWSASTTELLLTTTTSNNYTDWEYDINPNPESNETYILVSHATDKAGNFETSYKITVVYDVTIPEAFLTIDPSNPNGDNSWYITEPAITLTITDDKKTDYIEYQLNSTSGAWTTYSSTVTITDGQRKFYYRAWDKAGNVSNTGLKNVKVDTQNPDPIDNLRAEALDSIVVLEWDESPSGDIDYYRIYRDKDSNFIPNPETRLALVDAGKKSYDDTDADNDTKYYYYIIAFDTSGRNSDAVGINATPSAETPEVGETTTLAIAEGTVLGEQTTNIEEQPPIENKEEEEKEEKEEPKEGQIMGEQNQKSGFPWWTLLFLPLPFAYWYYKKTKENPYQS